MVMSLVWHVFEPLLFGLVGAEVSVEYMNSKVFGELLQWNNLQAGCCNLNMLDTKLQSVLILFSVPPRSTPCLYSVKSQLFHLVSAMALS